MSPSTTHTQYPVSVLPNRNTPGWGGPIDDDKAPSFAQQMTLREALENEHPSDAHFLMYVTKDDDGEVAPRMPRLKKAAAAYVRDDGGEVLCHLVALDFDNEGHAAWNQDNWKEFSDKRGEAEARSELIQNGWTALYTTRSGVRWIYKLDKPVTVEEHEQLLRHAGARIQCGTWLSQGRYR